MYQVYQSFDVDYFSNGAQFKQDFWENENFGGPLYKDEEDPDSVCGISNGPLNEYSLANNLEAYLREDHRQAL